MFRAINDRLQEDTMYSCGVWYCHSLRELSVPSRYTACSCRGQICWITIVSSLVYL